MTAQISDSDARLPAGRSAADQNETDQDETGQDESGQDESGRGIMLVDLLSDAWGIDLATPGKTIWFRLNIPGPTDTHASLHALRPTRPAEPGRGGFTFNRVHQGGAPW